MISPLAVMHKKFDSFSFASPDNDWSINLDICLSAVIVDVQFHKTYFGRERWWVGGEEKEKIHYYCYCDFSQIIIIIYLKIMRHFFIDLKNDLCGCFVR